MISGQYFFCWGYRHGKDLPFKKGNCAAARALYRKKIGAMYFIESISFERGPRGERCTWGIQFIVLVFWPKDFVCSFFAGCHEAPENFYIVCPTAGITSMDTGTIFSAETTGNCRRLALPPAAMSANGSYNIAPTLCWQGQSPSISSSEYVHSFW